MRAAWRFVALAVVAGWVPSSAAASSPVFSRASVAPAVTGAPALPASGAVTLAVDGRALDTFQRSGGSLVMPFPDGGNSVTLRLRPFPIFTPGAVVTRTGERGPERWDPGVTLLRGEVEGRPGSSVVLAVARRGVVGTIEWDDRRWLLGPLTADANAAAGALPLHVLADARALPPRGIGFECEADDLTGLDAAGRRAAERVPTIRGSSTARLECDVAIECDYEFFAVKHGSDVDRAMQYATALLGVVSTVYERDLNVDLRISYLNVWTTPADPYVATTREDGLSEFQSYWNANRTGVVRHTAHMLAGRTLNGGVAYLAALCDRTIGYGLSSIYGGNVYPSNTTTYDAFLVGHEIGHNFGSWHTQNCFWQDIGYAAPGALLDSCYAAEGLCYSGPTGIVPLGGGTLMSYCDQRGPVASTIRLAFHPACMQVMRAHAEACLGAAAFQPPSSLSAAIWGDSTALSWGPSPQPDVLRYDVHRSPIMLNTDPPLLGSTTSTDFSDRGRLGTYYYKVRAVTAGEESPFSNEVAVTVCAPTGASCYAGGSSAGAIQQGDFNADGIMDLAVANNLASGTVTILLGQGSAGAGNGAFGPATAFAAGSNPLAIEVVDVNDDGIPDLAVTNNVTSGTVSILLGHASAGVADGTFAPRVSYSVGPGPVAVCSGDWNEDGIVDLATVNRTNNTMSVLIGHGASGIGDGTFAPATTLATGSRPVAILAADLNQDGIADLVTANQNAGSVSVFIGHGAAGVGDGTFLPGVAYGSGTGAVAMALADLNQDGIADLAVTRGGTASSLLTILLGQGSGGVGDGTLGAPADHPAGPFAAGAAIADWNGDGIADVAVVNSQTTGTYSILVGETAGGSADGSFAAAQPFGAASVPIALTAQDWNSDGIPDLAIAHSASGTNVCVRMGSCAPDLSPAIVLTAPNGGETWPSGTERSITWSRGTGVTAVDIDLSRDDGAHWERVASNQIGTRFAWTVTDPPTAAGKARIRIIDHVVAGRRDASDAGFTIAPNPLLDAPDGRLLGAARLDAVVTDPGGRGVWVTFSLPRTAAARLEVVDVSGRRVRSRSVGDLGAGTHRVNLDDVRPLPSGLYWVRLTQGLETVTRKAVIAR